MMEYNNKELLQEQSAKYIADLFINHHVDCSIEKNRLLFEAEQISIATRCSVDNSNLDSIILQLDVYIDYNGVYPIIESFAGLGKDATAANIDAFKNFTNNSFHTILSAFFTSNYDSEVQKYIWNIHGKKFEVFSSNIGIRGVKPINFKTEWLEQFEAGIQQLPLEEGVHWIRLFYAQQQHTTTACEVLLNNKPCAPMLQKAENFDWQKQEKFYSLRVFMILKNGIDYKRVIKIIGSGEEYEKVYSRLEKMGLSELEIEKAYAFIPEAFGRKMIQEMGIKGNFSDQSTIENDKNERFEVHLSSDEMYAKAIQLATQLTKKGWNDNLKKVALMSASFKVLNQALNNGVKLEEIDCNSFSARFFISTYSDTESQIRKKPFWQFWS